MAEGMLGIHDPPGHGRGTGAMLVDELRRMRTRLGIENVVDVALAPDGDVLGLVAGHRHITHARKQLFELLRLRMGEFNEFETVRPSGVILADRGFRCVVRKRAHIILHAVTAIIAQTACNVLAFQRSIGVYFACFVQKYDIGCIYAAT